MEGEEEKRERGGEERIPKAGALRGTWKTHNFGSPWHLCLVPNQIMKSPLALGAAFMSKGALKRRWRITGRENLNFMETSLTLGKEWGKAWLCSRWVGVELPGEVA